MDRFELPDERESFSPWFDWGNVSPEAMEEFEEKLQNAPAWVFSHPAGDESHEGITMYWTEKGCRQERVEESACRVLEIELEGLPPSVNHSYRTTRSGVLYKTQVAKQWQSQAGDVASKAVSAWEAENALLGEGKPWDDCWVSGGYYRVALEFYPSKRTGARYDIDNRIKAVLDAMTYAEVWEDDRQVQELSVVKHNNPHREHPKGLTKITIQHSSGLGFKPLLDTRDELGEFPLAKKKRAKPKTKQPR